MSEVIAGFIDNYGIVALFVVCVLMVLLRLVTQYIYESGRISVIEQVNNKRKRKNSE